MVFPPMAVRPILTSTPTTAERVVRFVASPTQPQTAWAALVTLIFVIRAFLTVMRVPPTVVRPILAQTPTTAALAAIPARVVLPVPVALANAPGA